MEDAIKLLTPVVVVPEECHNFLNLMSITKELDMLTTAALFSNDVDEILIKPLFPSRIGLTYFYRY